MKRLVDLNPKWVGAGGEGITNALGEPVPERHGLGIVFDCPCGCDEPLYVWFANPLDGQPSVVDGVGYTNGWQRTGETFETLTLTPSILRSREHGGCGWHGWIRNGEIVSA